MEEAILITSSLLVGAGAGALLAHARDRTLLLHYGNLIHDLSRMLHRGPEPPEPPAAAARIPEWKPLPDAIGKRASSPPNYSVLK